MISISDCVFNPGYFWDNGLRDKEVPWWSEIIRIEIALVSSANHNGSEQAFGSRVSLGHIDVFQDKVLDSALRVYGANGQKIIRELLQQIVR